MTEHDPFERDLRKALAPERAPEALQRRIAQIPQDHRRPARARNAGGLRHLSRGSWLSMPSASWASGFAAAAASLAIGLWLGASGLAAADNSGNEDELAALVFSDVPTTIGDEL